MQVNRVSTGLQEELKTASHFNGARNETLFENTASIVTTSGATGKDGSGKNVDFKDNDIDDLNITPEQIEKLLGIFGDEIIKVFSSDILLDNPLRTPGDGQNGQEPSPSFTA